MATYEDLAATSWSQWTASQEASLAKTSPKPESASASRELAAAFGLSSPVWFANLDPDTFLPRTCQGSLFEEHSTELSESWPDSGMWDAGEVCELRSSEPPTCVNESSSWPTPRTTDAQSGRGVAEINGAFYRPRHWIEEGKLLGQANLSDVAEYWPTANTRDASPAVRHTTETEMWATATSRDWKDGATTLDNTPVNRLLGREVLVWDHSLPAPPIPDGPISSGSGQTSRRHWQNETGDLLWKTPRTEEHSQGSKRIDKYIKAGFRQRDDTRADQALDITLSTQVEALTKDKIPRRLNPRFVEWLLGFPVTWSER